MTLEKLKKKLQKLYKKLSKENYHNMGDYEKGQYNLIREIFKDIDKEQR